MSQGAAHQPRKARHTLSTQLYAIGRATGRTKWQSAKLAGSRATTRRGMANSARQVEQRRGYDEVLAEVERLVLERHLQAMSQAVRPQD